MTDRASVYSLDAESVQSYNSLNEAQVRSRRQVRKDICELVFLILLLCVVIAIDGSSGDDKDTQQ